MSGFTRWLQTASEDDKREASEWRHHYPVEQEVFDYDEDLDEWEEESHREVVCGCDPAFGHEFFEEGHKPGDPPYNLFAEDDEEED